VAGDIGEDVGVLGAGAEDDVEVVWCERNPAA